MTRSVIKKKVDAATIPICIGADVHLHTHTFLATHPLHGEIGSNTISNEPEEYRQLSEWLKNIQTEYNLPIVIGLENSCGTGEQVAEYLLRKNFPLKEVNSNYTANRRKLYPHRDKSDEIDARMISYALRDNFDKLGDVRLIHDAKIARVCKELSSDQKDLAKEETRLKNRLHKLLGETYGRNCYKVFCGTSTFTSQISLALFHAFPSLARLKEVNKKELIEALRKNSASSQTESKAKSFLKAVNSMTALSSPDDLHDARELRILQKTKRLLDIKKERKALEKLQRKYLEKLGTTLLSLKGCSFITASEIIGEIKDIRRFPFAAHLAKYTGVAPRESDSAGKGKKKKSATGNRRLYSSFYTIALSQLKNHPPAKEYYHRKVSEGNSKKQAITCLIRQLINVVYAMMTRNEEWEGGKKTE